MRLSKWTLCYFIVCRLKATFFASFADLHGKGFDLGFKLVTKRDNHITKKLIYTKKGDELHTDIIRRRSIFSLVSTSCIYHYNIYI